MGTITVGSSSFTLQYLHIGWSMRVFSFVFDIVNGALLCFGIGKKATGFELCPLILL